MNKKEFFNIMNDCYLAKNDNYPHSIFFIHDVQYNRNKKLCRILGKKLTFNKPNGGDIFFEANYKHGYFLVNSKIWELVGKNYHESKELITNWIKNKIKLEPDKAINFADYISLDTPSKIEIFKIYDTELFSLPFYKNLYNIDSNT